MTALKLSPYSRVNKHRSYAISDSGDGWTAPAHGNEKWTLDGTSFTGEAPAHSYVAVPNCVSAGKVGQRV
jgi:hypothetical protein